MTFVAKIREWLAGRKTYLLAGLLVVTVLVLVYMGRLTPETALTVGLVFAGLISASFRSAIEQHHAEVVSALLAIGAAGVEVRAGNKAAALQTVETAGLPVAEGLLATINGGAAGTETFHTGGPLPGDTL